jgi:hypothetical protein
VCPFCVYIGTIAFLPILNPSHCTCNGATINVSRFTRVWQTTFIYGAIIGFLRTVSSLPLNHHCAEITGNKTHRKCVKYVKRNPKKSNDFPINSNILTLTVR